MSSETVTKAIHRMGFAGEMTGHGFRAMASTILNDVRRPDGGRMWDADAIERQLSHKDSNQIRSAYNRGQYLEERRRMLQFWADYLDTLRDGAQIIQLKPVTIMNG
jgi:integrase